MSALAAAAIAGKHASIRRLWTATLLSIFFRSMSSVMCTCPRPSSWRTPSNLSLVRFSHDLILSFRYVGNMVDDRLQRRAFLMVERKSFLVATNGSNLGPDLHHAFQPNWA